MEKKKFKALGSDGGRVETGRAKVKGAKREVVCAEVRRASGPGEEKGRRGGEADRGGRGSRRPGGPACQGVAFRTSGKMQSHGSDGCVQGDLDEKTARSREGGQVLWMKDGSVSHLS